jgi:tRNA(fMet)-specific endonuclease VapC
MRYLLDSNSANDYIHQQYGVYERACREVSQGNRIGIAIPVLAELAAGIELSQSREKNFKHLQLAMNHLRLWPFEEAAAYLYGKLSADLQRKGKPIGNMDVMIAAVALELPRCTLVSTDQDFKSIQGLSVENWRVE